MSSLQLCQEFLTIAWIHCLIHASSPYTKLCHLQVAVHESLSDETAAQFFVSPGPCWLTLQA